MSDSLGRVSQTYEHFYGSNFLTSLGKLNKVSSKLKVFFDKNMSDGVSSVHQSLSFIPPTMSVLILQSRPEDFEKCRFLSLMYKSGGGKCRPNEDMEDLVFLISTKSNDLGLKDFSLQIGGY